MTIRNCYTAKKSFRSALLSHVSNSFHLLVGGLVTILNIHHDLIRRQIEKDGNIEIEFFLELPMVGTFHQ